MLDKYIECEMQHGQTSTPQHGLHDPIDSRRKEYFIFYILLVFFFRSFLLSLLFLSSFKKVAVLG